jgi:4-aminobutyrate aminotransferase
MIKITKQIKDVIDRDRGVIFSMKRVPYPFVADHGEGDYVYDIAGNKFIDFTSFISVYNLGEDGRVSIRNAAKEQIDKLMHPAFTDFYAELPVRFAEKLITMFPKGFGRVFFSDSGTEANEAALKFAKIFTKRQYVIAFYGAFHGRTMGSLGLTASNNVQRAHFGPFSSVIHSPYPYPYRFPYGDADECARFCISYLKDTILERDVAPDEVAAIVLEPIQGEGGYIVPPKLFVKELRKIASEHGILLVADEVQSGYMRTGKFLALDNFGVEADIYTMAKALGGGMAIGATIARRSLGDIPKGAHGTTFGGNLPEIAAANASLDYVKKNMGSLQAAVKKKGAMMMGRLNEMKGAYEIVGDVRGIGMMIGVELVKDKKGKIPAVEEKDAVLMEAFKNGLLLLPCGKSTIRIIPPITESMTDLAKGMDILEGAVKKVNGRARR